MDIERSPAVSLSPLSMNSLALLLHASASCCARRVTHSSFPSSAIARSVCIGWFDVFFSFFLVLKEIVLFVELCEFLENLHVKSEFCLMNIRFFTPTLKPFYGIIRSLNPFYFIRDKISIAISVVIPWLIKLLA